MKHRFYGLRALAAGLGLALFLGACSTGNSDTETLGTDPRFNEDGTVRVFAQFDVGTMPLPNDLLWELQRKKTDDRNLPAPVRLPLNPADDPKTAELKQEIESLALPGLSPNMFLTAPVTGAVQEDTLKVFAFRLDDSTALGRLLLAIHGGDRAQIGAAASAMEAPLTVGVPTAFDASDDFEVSQHEASGVLKLLPRRAFTAGAQYVVVIKKGLKDTVEPEPFDVASSITMSALKSATPFPTGSPFEKLESLRAAFNDGNPAAGKPGLFDIVKAVTGAFTGVPWGKNDVLEMWTFHTASVTLSSSGTLPYSGFGAVTGNLKGFSAARWGTQANALGWLDDHGNPSEGPAPVILPQLYGDYATDPELAPLIGYVLQTAPPDPNTDTVTNEDDPIDLIYFGKFRSPEVATIPTSEDDPPPVPTAVPFLLVTPRFATPPYQVVVFQHGILRDKFDALLTARAFAAQGLATLAIDAPYHGWRKQAGKEFLSADLGQVRINGYQAAVDLWETFDAIEAGEIDLDGQAGAELDGASPRFAAESLGSLLGSIFLSQDTRPVRIHLANPAAQLANILDASHKTQVAALAASFGTKGTTSYFVSLDVAQWLLDPVDSMYNGIGENPTSKLMAVSAYGDPIVSELSARTFLSSIGVDTLTVLAPPFPDPLPQEDTQAGAYRYGAPPAATQVIHFFTLAPFFDPLTPVEQGGEPWYRYYSPAVQAAATTAAQTQAAIFLAGSPPVEGVANR